MSASYRPAVPKCCGLRGRTFLRRLHSAVAQPLLFTLSSEGLALRAEGFTLSSEGAVLLGYSGVRGPQPLRLEDAAVCRALYSREHRDKAALRPYFFPS